jgi:hypothetical protein
MNESSAYDRWRPALASFAILATVVAVAVLRRDDGAAHEPDADDAPEAAADVVIDATSVPLVTVPLARTLGTGAEGDDVRRVQERLKALGFDPGPADGVFGQATVQAVWAFEKLVLGTPRGEATGEVTPATWTVMQDNVRIRPRRDADSPSHVEIYLPEQVLVVFEGEVPRLVTHMSSGSSEPWCEEVTIDPGEEGNDTDAQIKRGICGEAVTPPGIFYFYNRRMGTRETKLGTLYNPVYFNYNIAVHGAILVPLEPESHGCVRIPMSIARYFPGLVKYGDRVYVFDGIKEPEQYGSPVPPWDRPDPDYTTTTVTTLPPTTLAPTTTVPAATSTSVATATSAPSPGTTVAGGGAP